LFFRKKESIIVFQKIYTNGIYASSLKILLFFRPGQTVYDIDDADYVRRPAETIHYFMKNCSICAAGSQSLVEYIQRLNSSAFLLTSPVINHGLIRAANFSNFTIGWVGYYGAHRNSLHQLFFPAVRAIDFPVTLKILGIASDAEEQEVRAYFKSNHKVQLEIPRNLDWLNEHSIYLQICSFDIGVSPLLNTEINRAKSAFKLKQYLSCGVPVLASRVGENTTFLKEGINGYFCDTPEEFLNSIYTIYQALPDVYSQLSQNALGTIPEFNLDNYWESFRQSILSIQS
jgi:glycosyltransferase involved in cell wall biosynthesis